MSARRIVRRRLTAAAVVLALAVAGGGCGSGRTERGEAPELNPQRVALARSTPRLLTREPGWEVADAHTDGTSGQITFRPEGSDASYVELSWKPAEKFDDYRFELLAKYEELEAEDDESDGPAKAWTAHNFEVVGRDGYAVGAGRARTSGWAAWRMNRFAIRVKAELVGHGKLVDFVESFRQVDIGTWLDALGSNALRPGERPEVVDEMLTGVTLPPGLDADDLKAPNEGVESRLEVAEEVSGALACGWLDSWESALDANDGAGVERAVDGMAGAGEWPMVVELAGAAGERAEGAALLVRLAQAMPTDGPVETPEGPQPVRDAYPGLLDCEG